MDFFAEGFGLEMRRRNGFFAEGFGPEMRRRNGFFAGFRV
jgi:hypothetical protein